MLPTDAKARKNTPIFSGVLRYFPDALAAVAELSRIGNEQHNPGQPLHWDRSKSTDECDALVRHLLDAGTVDVDGVRHSTKVAWRALANLQKELEAIADGPLVANPAPKSAWVSWTGESDAPDCPGSAEVTVRFRDGATHTGCYARDWDWRHFGGSADIVAYCLA